MRVTKELKIIQLVIVNLSMTKPKKRGIFLISWELKRLLAS